MKQKRAGSSGVRWCFMLWRDVYLPEELAGDIPVADARIVPHNVLGDQIGSDLRFFSRNVNWRTRRIVQEILMHD